MNTCESPFFALIFNYMILLAIKKKKKGKRFVVRRMKICLPFHNM